MRLGAFFAWVAAATVAGMGVLVLSLVAAGAAHSPSASASGVSDPPAEEATLAIGDASTAAAMVACLRDAGLAVGDPVLNSSGSYDVSYGPFALSRHADHAGDVFRACYAGHFAGLRQASSAR